MAQLDTSPAGANDDSDIEWVESSTTTTYSIKFASKPSPQKGRGPVEPHVKRVRMNTIGEAAPSESDDEEKDKQYDEERGKGSYELHRELLVRR